MANATRTPGKPYFQPLDAAKPLSEEGKRWLLFRGLTEGRKAVSIQYPDTRCDYSDEVFQDYLQRTGLSGQNYRIPVDVVEAEPDDGPLVEEKLYTTLVPVAPVRFIRPREPGPAFPVERERNLAPLREGWLYLFLDGHLWREIQVRVIEGARPVFTDVNLTRYQGREERPATVEADTRVLLPYRVGDESRQDALQVCYAEQQWSWSYICRLGGMDPQDPRYIEALHSGEHYRRDYRGIDVDAAYRRKRLQRVDLHNHWIAGGEKAFSLWDSFLMEIDRAVEKEGQNQYRIDRRGEIPVLALHDPLAIARDLAAAHQVAWGGLRSLVKLVTGELDDAEMSATQNDFSSKREYEVHRKYLFEMRQQQASHKVALLAKAYFLSGKSPEIDKSLTGEAAEAQKEAVEQFNDIRYKVDPEKIKKILLTEERTKQRELITRTKATLVDYLLAGEEEDDPSYFTTVLAEQCTLEGDRLITPYETMTSLVTHLNDRTVDMDGALDGDERNDEVKEPDPGVTYVLRLLGRHPTENPLRLAGCLFPEQQGDEADNLYAINTSPVPKGVPKFDPNRWHKTASINKKASSIFVNLLEDLAKAENELKKLQAAASEQGTGGASVQAASKAAAGKGTALMPMLRLAFITRVTHLAQIDIPLIDYLTGRLPSGFVLFRGGEMARRQQEINKKFAKLAEADNWHIAMEVLQGEFRQDNPWRRQGEALMDEVRWFDGEWAGRFLKHDPELARFLQNEKVKLLVTYEEEVSELFDDAGQYLSYHYKRVVTLSGFVAAGGGQAGESAMVQTPRLQSLTAQSELPKVPKWYQKPGLTLMTRYSILGFASTFELWNLGFATEAFAKTYKRDGLIRSMFTREGYDLIGAVSDTAALGLEFSRTARIAAKGFDEKKALRLEKSIKRYQMANAGRMPALSAAEKTTLGTLKLVKWAARINVFASVVSMFDSGYDAYLAYQNRDQAGTLGGSMMATGFGMTAIAGFGLLQGLMEASLAGPLAWVGIACIVIGATIYFAFKKDRMELWFHHSPIIRDYPDSEWFGPERNGGDHGYWNEKPGLMLNEFLDLMIRPQIRFIDPGGIGGEVAIEIHYPFFVPGMSMTELEWAYVHENQLNEGEHIRYAEPEDWNRALKDQLKVQLQQEEAGRPSRVIAQRLLLPVESGCFRLKARLRFYPYGHGQRVAGSEIVLPEPERDDEGAPKTNDLWLHEGADGIRTGNSVRVYPLGERPMSSEERRRARHGRR